MYSFETGEQREVVTATLVQGFAWLPDGSGFVYSSSRGSTLLYPPVFNLRAVLLDGSGDRQLTFGDQSYVEPDVHASGKVVVGRITSRSDILRIPVGGTPAENTGRAFRVTRQTGQVQVPSASPDDREVVFVSDTGGHTNLWIAKTDGSGTRPITFETDPTIAIGVPAWSPRGDLIAFVRSDDGKAALWAVRPDGSGLRQVVRGWAPSWSADGRWLYYWRLDVEPGVLERIPIAGGPAESDARSIRHPHPGDVAGRRNALLRPDGTFQRSGYLGHGIPRVRARVSARWTSRDDGESGRRTSAGAVAEHLPSHQTVNAWPRCKSTARRRTSGHCRLRVDR